jgi:hypothetical protein
MTDGTSATTSADLDLFISHFSKVGIAKQLFELIEKHVYAGDAHDRVFFSSHPGHGLIGGDNLEEIFRKLARAKRVVAVVTQRSIEAPAVLAEMAIAGATPKKLVPAAGRKAYLPLKWPFAEVLGRPLDDPNQVEALLGELAANAGTTLTNPSLKGDCEALAEAARGECPDPAARKRWLQVALAAATLLAFVGAFLLGKESPSAEGTRTFAVGSSVQNIDGAQVKLLFASTLPRKLLSGRLHKLQSDLAGLPLQPGSKVDSALATKLLMTAVRQTNGTWALSDQELRSLETIAARWDGGGSGLESGSRVACAELKKEADQQWCAVITGLSGGLPDRFDDTPFAVVAVGDPQDPKNWQAVTEGTLIEGHSQWKVTDVNGVTIKVDP